MNEKELSYVDLLRHLQENVRSDAIPEEQKKEIMSHITALQALLWPYSA